MDLLKDKPGYIYFPGKYGDICILLVFAFNEQEHDIYQRIVNFKIV